MEAARRLVATLAAVLLVVAVSERGDRSTANQAAGAAAPQAVASRPALALPRLAHSCLEPSDRAGAGWFRAADGVWLAGVALGGGEVGVLLAHQRYHDLCDWMPLARSLAGHGYLALAFDFRGFGASEFGEHGDGFPDELQKRRLDLDVEAGVAELRRLGARRIVVAGASMGGTATLVAGSALGGRVAGVVSLSSPARFYDMDAEQAVRGLEVAALFIAAERDGSFARDARALYLAAASREKRLVMISGSAHGTGMVGLDLSAERIRTLIEAFVKEHGDPVPVDL